MRLKLPQDPSRTFSTECVRMRRFRSSTGFHGNFSLSCLLTLDLDNFRFIQVDFVAEGGFLGSGGEVHHPTILGLNLGLGLGGLGGELRVRVSTLDGGLLHQRPIFIDNTRWIS